LALVNGPPASGKSTLARHLASALRLPLLSRDALKEAMADRVPFEGLAESERFGRASVGVFYAVAAEILASGIGVVLDNVFARGVAERDLRPLLPATRTVQVYCTVPPEAVQRRYVARYERGERHPAHFDGERIARVRSGARQIDWSRFEALDLGLPTLRVDTTSGYQPDLDTIIGFVRTAGAEHPCSARLTARPRG
jgi:predicted kinase